MRDLFQTPGFGDTIDFGQIKEHYYVVHEDINPTRIVPKGPDLSNWLTPHGRQQLGGRPIGDGTPPDSKSPMTWATPAHVEVLCVQHLAAETRALPAPTM